MGFSVASSLLSRLEQASRMNTVFLPLPLGEGRGEGLAQSTFFIFIARLRRAQIQNEGSPRKPSP